MCFLLVNVSFLLVRRIVQALRGRIACRRRGRVWSKPSWHRPDDTVVRTQTVVSSDVNAFNSTACTRRKTWTCCSTRVEGAWPSATGSAQVLREQIEVYRHPYSGPCSERYSVACLCWCCCELIIASNTNAHKVCCNFLTRWTTNKSPFHPTGWIGIGTHIERKLVNSCTVLACSFVHFTCSCSPIRMESEESLHAHAPEQMDESSNSEPEYIPIGCHATNPDGKICKCGSRTHMTSTSHMCPLHNRWSSEDTYNETRLQVHLVNTNTHPHPH